MSFDRNRLSQAIGRSGFVIAKMKACGKEVIPYVRGDTTTTMAASNAGYANECAAVHVEAGIRRTLTPRRELIDGLARMDASDREAVVGRWQERLRDREQWARGMRVVPKIYGENVSAGCIDAVEKVLATGEVFRH